MEAAIDVFSYHSRLDLVGYLFWIKRTFESISDYIGPSPREGEMKEKR